ncbi:murein L,D-transpeptidase catalytic domain family protein [Terrimonas sp. NA20]|uniref:Murein L,D-transpeptidase catalytic domain family protein n=1 Tax=Terrimonas ginsenosidimutans TaxID=2908004 RepID=A0ABS9KLB3_9BACT|nr:murein L,D-transpeptidase catalytic domain family protein [Terrimonas ginsenosidimutans]MCG2613123.1 murein L,D-transpeptidase catalytic domain family protein [Terrimonas ginsenosidimutans]
MKNTLTTTLYCLCLAALSLSWKPAANADKSTEKPTVVLNAGSSAASAKIHSLYVSMDLRAMGLSEEAFTYACKGYENMLEKRLIRKEGYLMICDFSQSSARKRMYIIDMENQELVKNTYVAHGKNSGGEYARAFSNRNGSLQSSLGFYVTRQTYYGEHGLSLRVNGVERGVNDKAYARAIVVHGANYIGSQKKGRSFGCPAVPQQESAEIINTMKDGHCIFIYHPSKKYLSTSKILND